MFFFNNALSCARTNGKYIAVEIAKFIICTTAPCQPLSKKSCNYWRCCPWYLNGTKRRHEPMLIEKYVTNNAIKGTNTNGTSKYGLNTIGKPK